MKIFLILLTVKLFFAARLLFPAPLTAQSCPIADANGDCQVDGLDFNIWRNNYEQSTSQGKLKGDFNNDNMVNGLDYVLWLNDYGSSGNTNPPPTITSNISPTGSPVPVTLFPSSDGMWLSSKEIASLPTSGTAWNAVLSAANSSVSTPNLNQRDNDNTNTYAKALIYARTGNTKYRDEVRQILSKVMGTEKSANDVLAVLRNTYAYVIAADLINLKNFDPSFNSTFTGWLSKLRTNTSGGSCNHIIECHEKRPNNWGANAAASRIAIDLYINDKTDLTKAAAIHKGWMGDRSSYSSFTYGDLSWQCDPGKPVGINPKGCTKSGFTIDGVLPDDQRRAGGFTNNPPCENYVWGALQGATVATQLLQRAGYPAWDWQDKAILRAAQWLHSSQVKGTNWCAASGDDAWVPFLINKVYGTSFPGDPASVGKGLGFTGWTHAK
ncbi:hypothetical protein A3D05_00030 [Candidatus Gottesmanbacteria bacterium RIFCSPHIGHO2_02_FULL_40_24]|uniref:Uncharacterized protein n=1 Tax=Candidatus Gottesmanbacteria bacterium RIFCSPHIGHO2_01_FULL_40_15 TaxID=1798376 RepID=A0A1F5Z6Y2_9BACT|nr:MAG: hypothetical protein A2777_00035 [Candidatus Gottesmanbacteria bacterium RIFCSPHIGHO2_01_FULL_40_15]OGG17742.1 MAG: hypothetical protein A3D05_00030 [Candidatus Gottesmanbacteria bacterium RIFCSPHIGHO2_02_FULL_40_24]OGG21855.1 MAG: hypothetical protein A3B48_03960 [Candidatus Gottesmanbacteria bacterium RIFCSPLOWO2_01_FULL_40_10]OGG25486.1 MAG: hypothetical protein A3E42_03500 [Candidatus Gottesmanbacteria bacterium RIFCSPHIGHO2_12_FULL_40_13]OGG33145.1 MAG: hypothetical protein A3I80_0